MKRFFIATLVLIGMALLVDSCTKDYPIDIIGKWLWIKTECYENGKYDGDETGGNILWIFTVDGIWSEFDLNNGSLDSDNYAVHGRTLVIGEDKYTIRTLKGDKLILQIEEDEFRDVVYFERFVE